MVKHRFPNFTAYSEFGLFLHDAWGGLFPVSRPTNATQNLPAETEGVQKQVRQSKFSPTTPQSPCSSPRYPSALALLVQPYSCALAALFTPSVLLHMGCPETLLRRSHTFQHAPSPPLRPQFQQIMYPTVRLYLVQP